MHYLFLLLITPFVLFAQPNSMNIPFQKMNGDLYKNALAGGLTNPQFSEIDLDGDGDKDLVYFDRQGFVVVPFLNGGTPNVADYTYAPEYAYRFPKLERWMLLRDYNCDGLEDIFAYKYDYQTGAVSITVYKGIRDAQNKIQFVLAHNGLRFHNKNQTQLFNLYNSSIDLPAVDDIDGDGDMDILNFNQSGGYIELFKNESQEKGWGCDSLHYVFADNCWGRVYESGITEYLSLSSTIDSCPNYPGWTPIKSGGLHSGSTITTLDMDNDGDKEVLLGDLSFNNLNLLTNGRNKDTAHFVAQQPFFPQNSFPVAIDIFPAAFYLDVNNDGAKDLLVVPNIAGNSVDDKNWYYKNTGTVTQPIFTYQQNEFLVEEMLDFGTGAAPTFVDINGDGLTDIVVGNHSKFLTSMTEESYLRLYENIGSATQPVYKLTSIDFASMKQYGKKRLAPTFGDLDGDGDLDLMVGLEDGKLIYVENQGSATAPNFSTISPNYAGIDVDNNATPQLIDVDRDGDLDMIIGERKGNLNYYENTGTALSPTFATTPSSATFGLITTKIPGQIDGNSAPFMLDISGQYHLFVGGITGELWQFNNIDGNLTGGFTRVNSVLDSLDEGMQTVPTIKDLTNDGQFEILIGNLRGGLTLYSEGLVSSITTLATIKNNLIIAPNPASSSIKISFLDVINEEVDLKIINLLGQVVYQQNTWVNEQLDLNINQLPTGSYLLHISTSKGLYVGKVNIVESR